MRIRKEQLPKQRRHQRVKTSRAIGIHIPHWAGLEAECIDISHGGMRLRLQNTVHRGDRLVFEAELPGFGPVRLDGEVRHVVQLPDGAFEAGLCWVDPDARAARLFEMVVQDGLAPAA